MFGCFKFCCLALLVTSSQYLDGAADGAAIVRRIQSFTNETHSRSDPRLVEYLKSLTPQESLSAARYACAEADRNPEFQELPAQKRSVGTAQAALLCLSYFFERCDSVEAGGDMLRSVAADRSEHPGLRRAIIASMDAGIGGKFPHFLENINSYATAHEAKVAELLDRITKDKDDDLFVRSEAIRTYATRLRNKGRSICMSDPSAIALSGGSKTPLRLGDLVRSGELRLSEETWHALTPIDERAVAHASDLAKIALDPEEPADLRQQVRQTVEQYQQIPMKDDGMISAILSKVEADAP